MSRNHPSPSKTTAGHMYLSSIQTLIAARTRQGKSQRYVANFVGVERQAVTAWESGETIPTLENFLRYCACLDITVRLQPNE